MTDDTVKEKDDTAAIEVVADDKKPEPKPKVKKKSYSDDELESLIQERLENQKIEQQAELEAKKLNAFKSADDCVITDHEFLMRLYSLSVNKQWLKYFKNDDKVLTTAQIWDRIRNRSLNR